MSKKELVNCFGETQCTVCGDWRQPNIPCYNCSLIAADKILEAEGEEAWRNYLTGCEFSKEEIQDLWQTKMDYVDLTIY